MAEVPRTLIPRVVIVGDPLVVAVVGSRRWRDLGRVRAFVGRIAEKYPEAVLVSGGALGADRAAERAGIRAGLRVLSFRPEPAMPHDLGNKPWAAWTPDDLIDGGAYRAAWDSYLAEVHALAGVYLVAAYEFWPDGRERRHVLPDRFDSFREAAFFRNGLVVEVADEVVAFHRDNSGGTADTCRKALAAGKGLHRIAA